MLFYFILEYRTTISFIYFKSDDGAPVKNFAGDLFAALKHNKHFIN